MNKKIGIIDTGIGGLTVVRAFQKLLPKEELLYFGDNLNCPYGNKSKEEILGLTMNILDFMSKFDLKILIIACNTISTLIKDYEDKFDIKVFDIISPTVDYIIELDSYSICILATEFTINTGVYKNKILEKNKDISIRAESSKLLAGLIDKGLLDTDETKKVVKEHLNNLMEKGDCYNLVLACTHYPIVEELFTEYAPQLNIIDPGFQLARSVREYLEDKNLLNDGDKGSLDIYTSGETGIYEKIIDKLKLKNVIGIKQV